MQTLRYVIVILFHLLLNPGNSQDLISVANSFLNEKNYVEAKKSIDEAFVKSDLSQNARAWYTKGRVYHEILKSDDSNLDGYKANLSSFVGEIIEAYEKAKTLTGRGNNLFILSNNQQEMLWANHMNKGYDLWQKQDFLKAVDAFDVAKIAKPNDTTGYLYACYSAQRAGKFQLAIDNYMAMKKLTKLSKEVYNSLIICKRFKRSPLAERLDTVEEAIFHYADHIPYIIEENMLLVQMGRYEEAESRLNTVLKRNPQVYDLVLLRADLFDRVFKESYNEGQPERSERYFDLASEDYERFLVQFPTHFKANHNYAVMMNERANRYYVSANLLSEEEYQISGKETEEQGHTWTRKALPYMERALDLQPNDEDVLKALRAFYQRLKLEEKLAKLKDQ